VVEEREGAADEAKRPELRNPVPEDMPTDPPLVPGPLPSGAEPFPGHDPPAHEAI
jgi:hypothetical protein